jgi:hypothetical protein
MAFIFNLFIVDEGGVRRVIHSGVEERALSSILVY